MPEDRRPGARRVVAFRRLRLWSLLAGVVIATALLFGLRLTPPNWRDHSIDPPSNPALARLVEAVGTERYIDARLTGGFRHGPPQPRRRSTDESGPKGSISLLAAAGELQKRTASQRDGHTTHALAVARLLLGEYDEAIGELERLLRDNAGAADLCADLAAAYLTRAEYGLRPDDWVKALDMTERALSVRHDFPEAQFNRALALQGLGLFDQAQRAWESYRREQPDEAWAAEAGRRLEDLRNTRQQSHVPDLEQTFLEALDAGDVERSKALAAKNVALIRDLAQNALQAEWARAHAGGNLAASQQAVFRLRSTEQILAGFGYDRDLAEGVRTIEQLQSLADPRDANVAAEALIQFAQAIALYESDQVVAAQIVFDRLIGPLRKYSLPAGDWAELYSSIADYYKADYNAVEVRLNRLAAKAESRGFRRLLGRTHWMLGLLAFVRARHGLAVDEYERASQLFGMLGDEANRVAVGNLLADALVYLGEHQTAWDHRLQALRHLDAIGQPRRRHTLLLGATTACQRLTLPLAAGRFVEQAVTNATAWGSPAGRAEALMYRARLDPDAGSAREDLSEAQKLVQAIPDTTLRRRFSLEATQTTVAVLARTDPRGALEALPDADAEELGDVIRQRVPRLELLRAEAYLALNDTASASAALARAVAALKTSAITLSTPVSGVTLADEAARVFRRSIELEIRNGRPAEAFALLEQWRSLPSGRAGNVEALSRAVAPRTVVIAFCEAEGRVYRWVIRFESVSFSATSLTHDNVTAAVQALDDARTGSPDLTSTARTVLSSLHDGLFGSIDLTGVDRVLVIPDGVLGSVPWHALRERDGRFLIERVAVAVVPAASRLRLGDAAKDDAELRLMVVADPTPRRMGLRPLPGAIGEARKLATLFPGAGQLLGDRATARSFLAELPTHNAVHLALHSVANPESPLLSSLFFSTSASPSRATTADVLGLKLSTLRLAFVASCQSAVKGTHGGGLSLAEAFLVAGAHEAVGSLKDLDDDTVGTWLEDFYAAYVRRGDAAAAFREALMKEPARLSRSDWVWITVLSTHVNTEERRNHGNPT